MTSCRAALLVEPNRGIGDAGSALHAVERGVAIKAVIDPSL
jgi:hypothetical protein